MVKRVTTVMVDSTDANVDADVNTDANTNANAVSADHELTLLPSAQVPTPLLVNSSTLNKHYHHNDY